MVKEDASGTKHDVLTEAEISAFQLDARVSDVIKHSAIEYGIPVTELRVLDWGCGRGRTVIKLLDNGIDAYGVDIDPVPIRNAASALTMRGHDLQNRLICIGLDCRTPFPDEYFHVVVSDQVFEHVRDLDAMASELARITKIKGAGFHSFPAKWCFIEPHLLIPCVHWLPKNRTRRWYINSMIRQMPLWKNTKGKTTKERVEIFYDYSITKTYYRSLSTMRRILGNRGFKVRLNSNTVAIGRFRLLKKLMPARLRNRVSNNFRSVTLYTTRD